MRYRMYKERGLCLIFKFMSRTIIIGAGPAGLAMAGRLRKAGMDFEILEQEHQIAPAWHRHYQRLCLHTVKKYSNLPHVELPSALPKYVPRADLVRYYENYATQMDIAPRFGQRVEHLSRAENGWLIETNSYRYNADNVVVATGFNRQPYSPTWPGMDLYTGQLMHSRFYRSGADFYGKKVLVVGFGNTGAEIALDLHEQGAEVALSVRGPVSVVPRDFMGNPTQESAMLLSKLPYFVSDSLGKLVQRLAIGDMSRYGLQLASQPPAWQQRTFGKTPVMDLGTVAAIKRGDIAVFPGIEQFDAQKVHFSDARSEAFDAVVLATGYRAAVEEFVEGAQELFDAQGIPSALWFNTRPGLYFLGFDAYSNGLLWSIREDSGKICKHILSRRESPHKVAELSGR